MKTIKQHIALGATLFCGALSLTSCLNFDTTGAEFNTNSSTIDKVVNRGDVDYLDYRNIISGDSATKVLKALDSHVKVANASIFWMRGGKDGLAPAEHAYQYQFSLGVDNYAQYSVIPHQNFIYSKILITSTYNIDPKAYGGAYGSFQGMTSSVIPLLNHPMVDQIPELKALFLLFYNYSAIEVADIYGPLPYTDLKTNKQTHPYVYNDLRTIYHQAVQNVDSILATFHYYKNKPEDYRKVVGTQMMKSTRPLLYSPFGTFDENIWIRFANSLKLRLAMHIVKVDPVTAQKWAEEAVADGVIENVEQEIALRPASIFAFGQPLLQIFNGWGDARMTASMESLLKSLNHPFIHELTEESFEGQVHKTSYLFRTNQQQFINNKSGEVTPAEARVVGMRSGAHPGEGQNYDGNQYIAFSDLNPTYFSSAPLYLMKLSEVCFLRAEGALRGWNMGGTAQQFYEEGIRYAGFEDRARKTVTYMGEDGTEEPRNLYDALVDQYMEQTKPTPYVYKDPTGDTPDAESVTKIGVKWNEADDFETKLEKIITQKYIAGFPYSFEAFVDMRRTGYPKLLEVLNADECDGSIMQGEILRRLPFPMRDDASYKQDIDATALPALGGADVCGTRLWWDVTKGNQ